MALLWDASLTDAGVSMISQWAQGTGNKLTITGGVIGEGVVSASQLHALTQLTDEKSTISIQGFESVANGVKLKLRKTSQGITTSFILNQIGIYAKLDTSGGTPIIADSLIAVYQQDTGVLVPTEADSPDFVFTFYGTIQTNYSGDLTINVDTSALASQDDLDALTLAGLADTDADTPSEDNLLFFKGSTDKWTAQANPFSKENILINWDFTHPINETGATSGTFAPVREILGKWETDYSGDGSRTYAITSQGLQINNDQAAVGFVKQTFETALDASKTYTLTIEFSDDHKETATGDLTSLLYTAYYSGISLQCTDTYVQLRIQASAGGTVAHVKVETGNISTLANDVAPNQTLETIKCQGADFRSVSHIMATGSTNTTGAQIDAGTFFYLNGSFCKALTNIAVNATFTLNTNFEVTSVGEELTKSTEFEQNNDAFTYDTGITKSTYQRIYKIGKTLYATLVFTVGNSSIAAWQKIGSFISGYKPAYISGGMIISANTVKTDGFINTDNAGDLYLSFGLQANTAYAFSFVIPLS